MMISMKAMVTPIAMRQPAATLGLSTTLPPELRVLLVAPPLTGPG